MEKGYSFNPMVKKMWRMEEWLKRKMGDF